MCPIFGLMEVTGKSSRDDLVIHTCDLHFSIPMNMSVHIYIIYIYIQRYITCISTLLSLCWIDLSILNYSKITNAEHMIVIFQQQQRLQQRHCNIQWHECFQTVSIPKVCHSELEFSERPGGSFCKVITTLCARAMSSIVGGARDSNSAQNLSNISLTGVVCCCQRIVMPRTDVASIICQSYTALAGQKYVFFELAVTYTGSDVFN